MPDEVISIQAKTLSGHISTFQCSEIISIDGKSLEDFAKDYATEDAAYFNNMLMNLDGRLTALDSMVVGLIQKLVSPKENQKNPSDIPDDDSP